MRVPGNAELLEVWEAGLPLARDQGGGNRLALLLLAAFNPGIGPEALAELPIGRRDNLLLTLREWTFGPRLTALATCPQHGGSLELDFNVQDIRVGEVDEVDGRFSEPLSFTMNGYEVSYRLPNSADLAAVAVKERVAEAEDALLRRCLVGIRHEGSSVAPESLPEGEFEAVAAALTAEMSSQDPQADTRLAVVCPECGHEWEISFDIVSYFWAEIDAWARRTLREVHILASTYGWSEREILALTPNRRRLYLEVIQS